MLVPKEKELVATPYRHGSKQKAEAFFINGMTEALCNMAACCHPVLPVTIYYAFKQSENNKDGTASTGWETFLEVCINAGFVICGTWPLRTEKQGRVIGIGTNALASSIIIVCRKRDSESPVISRKQFVRELELSLP